MKVFRSMAPAVASAMCAAALPGTGAAAESADDGLDEVVIFGRYVEETRSYVPKSTSTGTRSDAPVKEIPFVVSAITRGLLEDQRPRSTGEALRNVAGFQPQPGFGALNSGVRIRGFVPNAILRNGFRQSTFTPDIDLATVAQIEVLKGPGSALYGRFEPGGLVNIVSKRPTEEPLLEAQLSGGSQSLYRGTLDAGERVTEKLLYRANLAYEDTESYRDFFGTRKALFAPVLEYRVSDATRVLMDATYIYRDGGFDRGFLLPTTADLGRSLLELPRSRNLGEPSDSSLLHSLTSSVIVEHRFADHWRGRVGAFYSDSRLHDDFFTSGAPLMPNATTYNRRMLYSMDNQRDYTVNAELIGSVELAGMQHRLLLGADTTSERYEYDAQRVPTNSPINPLAPVYGQGVYSPTVLAFAGTNRYRAVGAYLQDEIALGERWSLLAGGRFDSTEGTYQVSGTPPVDRDRRVSAFSPRAGVTFAMSSQVSLYASFSRSFAPELSGLLVGGEMTDPSRGKQYEAGLKAGSADSRYLATLAVYDLRKTNVVVSDPMNPGFSVQSGEQRSRGVEVELSAELTSAWRVIASYAYDDAEISRDTNAALVGNRIVNVPETTGSLWSTYDLQIGAAGTVRVGAGAFHVSDRAVNNANLFFLPSYTRYDAMVSYRAAAWSLALNLQNLTDEKYFDSAGGAFHPMPPRQLFGTFTYRFAP